VTGELEGIAMEREWIPSAWGEDRLLYNYRHTLAESISFETGSLRKKLCVVVGFDSMYTGWIFRILLQTALFLWRTRTSYWISTMTLPSTQAPNE
jgi:hypothetical protein